MRLTYNAPTVLTFTFVSAAVLALTQTIAPQLIVWFAVPGRLNFSFYRLRDDVTLFTYVLGHMNLEHFVSNFSLMLIIGPLLEEQYGSLRLALMIGITALVGGLLNALFFSTGLLGASGVVFMMILLASFANVRRGEIPLTFILVAVLYLGVEFLNSFRDDNISQFGHIAGGFCGSLFGFLRPPAHSPSRPAG